MPQRRPLPGCERFGSRLPPRLGRRAAVAGASLAALTSRASRAETTPDDPDEDLRNLRLLDIVESGRRVLLIRPAYAQPEQRLPVVVLLHGLGETGNPRLGAYAWLERYGLGRAWQRLARPPVTRTSPRGEWTDARLHEVSEELSQRPFRGFVMACPHMPNVRGAAELEAYSTWLTTSLLARVRKENPHASASPEETYLAGVSLGGWVSLEVLARAPGVFGAWAGVQTAISTGAAERFARRIAETRPRPRAMFVLTSTQDEWRPSSEALATTLRAHGVPTDARVTPGPHDQLWLREAGTIETLLWLDRLSYAGDRGASRPRALRVLPTRDAEAPRRCRGDDAARR